ncbi:MAG: hypothetical protein IPN16_17560 [Gemmatimonadetes bacterium]|nr:hypothetical protein [Gemmatimonadota bacterium]
MFHRFAPRRVLAVLLCTVPIAPRIAVAQGDSLPPPPSSNLGLAAIGAVTMHGGWASIQHGFHAGQLGGTVDFGYLTSRRIRLVADATYLLTLPHEETVASEERTYRNVFRDLSAHLALAFHATSPSARFAPYLATGVGVHVLSSSFGSLAIDTRYNTNNFGLLAAVGARVRVGASGRRAMQVEVQTLQARNVRRVAVTVGVAALFNDLVKR